MDPTKKDLWAQSKSNDEANTLHESYPQISLSRPAKSDLSYQSPPEIKVLTVGEPLHVGASSTQSIEAFSNHTSESLASGPSSPSSSSIASNSGTRTDPQDSYYEMLVNYHEDITVWGQEHPTKKERRFFPSSWIEEKTTYKRIHEILTFCLPEKSNSGITSLANWLANNGRILFAMTIWSNANLIHLFELREKTFTDKDLPVKDKASSGNSNLSKPWVKWIKKVQALFVLSPIESKFNEKFDHDQILPFQGWRPLNEGSFGKVHRVFLPPEYNRLTGSNVSADTRKGFWILNNI
jgi:hypothetical protein